jgi:hypothetical protein
MNFLDFLNLKKDEESSMPLNMTQSQPTATTPNAPQNAQDAERSKAVEAYLKQTYPERQKLQERAEKEPSKWNKALMGFSAGLAGRDQVQAVNSLSDDQRKAQADLEKLDAKELAAHEQIFKDKLKSRQEHQWGLEDLRRETEEDPASEESRMAQQLASTMMPGRDFSKMSASKLKELLPSLSKAFEVRSRNEDKQEARDFKREEAMLRRTEGKSDGQKVLDREFSKDFNEWQTRNKAGVEKNLDLLRQTKQTLEKRKNDMVGTSGRITGRLPDFLRSEESIRLREDVHRAVQATLRATLGAQFTEKEGERIMNASYNEKLSPAENIKKIDAAIKELENNVRVMDDRANYFEENGTLVGYRAPKSSEGSPKPKALKDKQVSKKMYSNSANKTRIIYTDGTEEILDGRH